MYIEECKVKLKNGELLLRSPDESDAGMLLRFLRTVCGETRYLAKEPEEWTLTEEAIDGERRFIRFLLESEKSVMLLGYLDGEYVGNCSLTEKPGLRQRHQTVLGIALFEKYTGQGIGKAMLKKLLCIAKEQGYEQVEFEVAAGNARAISLYEKFGFERYGTFPDYVKYSDGTYEDMIRMMKRI